MQAKNRDDAHTTGVIGNAREKDSMTYKKPMVNIPIRISLCFKGNCSLNNIGSGRMKIPTSVTMFKLEVVYQNVKSEKHLPWMLKSQ
jgi:hypothetical protein